MDPRGAPDPVTGLAGRGRVRALDLARGLAVFFMIPVHVLWHWGAPETWSTPIGHVISFLGGPTAAPVFMFLMGASLAFSSRSTFSSLASRGLYLLALGYLLNALRGAVPATLGLAAGVVTLDEIAPFTPEWLLTTVDIHHMAGLSLVAIAALRVATRPGWPWLVLAAAVTVLAPEVRGIDVGIAPVDALLAPLLGSAPNVYYAVVPWIVYPLTGAVFGTIVARSGDRAATFRLGAIIGLGLCMAGVALVAIEGPSFDVATYWRSPVSFVVGILGIVLVWLGLCDIVARRVPAIPPLRVLYGWSDRVIAMYITHWIIVGWGIGFVGFRALDLDAVLVAIVVAVGLTSAISRVRLRLPDMPSQARPVGP